MPKIQIPTPISQDTQFRRATSPTMKIPGEASWANGSEHHAGDAEGGRCGFSPCQSGPFMGYLGGPLLGEKYVMKVAILKV